MYCHGDRVRIIFSGAILSGIVRYHIGDKIAVLIGGWLTIEAPPDRLRLQSATS